MTTTGRIIVAGAAGAGALLAASVPETLAPRGTREQLLASGISGIAGLAVGGIAGTAATGLSTRAGVTVAAALAVGGGATWLALGGAPGEARAPSIASAGFMAAVGGTAMLAQHGLGGRFGRPVGALLGAVAGAALAGGLVAIGSAVRGSSPHPDAPPDHARPPWALDGAGRAKVATIVGTGLVGGALATSGGVRLAARAPLGIRIGLVAATAIGAGLAATKAWSVASATMGRHGSARIDASVQVPDTASGGGRSGYEPDDLPTSVERFLRQGVTAARAATYRPDLPASELHDAIRAYAPLRAGQTIDAQADAAISELERLGGFDRDVLHVVLPTGGGGVNEGLAGIVESYAGGDAATIGLQYADRPSVLALSEAPRGAQLLDAFLERLERRLDRQPAESRPKVVVSGYSLGAEALRHSLADSGRRARIDRVVDGMLVVGPRNLTASVGMDGLHDATVVDSADQLPDVIARPAGAARVVVVQHASDPTGNGVLGLGLRDARNPQLADRSQFIPFATLAGTAADMTLVGYRDVPLGTAWRGHGYSADLPDAIRVAFGMDDVPQATRDLVATRTDERIEGVALGDTDVGGD